MKVRKFEGATMRDAIARVKAELGDQAVILSTREVRRGLLGSAVEISVALDEAGEDTTTPAFAQARPAAPRASNDGELEKLLAPLRSELRSLRALVRSSSEPKAGSDLRNELVALRKLVEDLRPQPPAPRPASAAAATRRPNTALVAPSVGRRILLVGPTGVGKTTTIAKLAARAALVDGKNVSLVTLDNYRVGGVEQIRAFAELIGVPLHVAESAADLPDLLADDSDLTFIDTAGRSPRDTVSIAELAANIDAIPDLEVHLVLAAGTSAAQIDAIVARYQSLRPARLLFTKVDEVDVAPELAAAPPRCGLPITWITTGQQVPEDLEEPTAGRVLELATGGMPLTPPTPTAILSPSTRGYQAA